MEHAPADRSLALASEADGRIMERKIIVGYDPERGGPDALRLGRLLAGALAAKPIIVTALPWPRYLAPAEELQRQADAEMQPRFAALRDELGALEIETRAVAGQSAARALHELSDSEDAELIVLGSCHRGQLGRTFAGSVGESLMHGAPCAVAVAPREYADRKQHRLLRIAVAFDGSPEAWTALETGIGLAERCHGQLTVVTVADYPRYGYAAAWSVLTIGEIEDAERKEKQRLLELALGRTPAGLACEGRMLMGDAGSVLAEASDEFDLMITGSRAYGPLRRSLLGSTTRKLIRSSTCPVLVLPRAVGVDPFSLRSSAASGVRTLHEARN